MALENAVYISIGVGIITFILAYISSQFDPKKEFWFGIFRLFIIMVVTTLLLLIPYSFVAYNSENTTLINNTVLDTTNTTTYFYTTYDITNTTTIQDIFFSAYAWFVIMFDTILTLYLLYKVFDYMGWFQGIKKLMGGM